VKRSRADGVPDDDGSTSRPNQSPLPNDLELAQRAHDLYLAKRVTDVLNRIRPLVQGDGVDIQLAAVQDRCVTLRITGALCAAAPLNFQEGLEEVLRQEIAGLGEVRLLTTPWEAPPPRR